jgi:hypothetical protein
MSTLKGCLGMSDSMRSIRPPYGDSVKTVRAPGTSDIATGMQDLSKTHTGVWEACDAAEDGGEGSGWLSTKEPKYMII